MKLTIGENIRNFRKKNGLTQEALADRLGVTYQSVSRWENGTTYPDLELLPAISGVLAITVDELIGMPAMEKEKRAAEAFDGLRRACMKQDYDADQIVTLLRDIRRNYLDSSSAWRPWAEGNNRAFRDPDILPEVRLLAEAYLARHPMHAHTIQTMADVEDEEHLPTFLEQYTTAFDCSERALLFHRYWTRRDATSFEPERRYQLYQAFHTLLCSRYLTGWSKEPKAAKAANGFIQDMLALIRGDAVDARPDMWVEDRIALGLDSARHSVSDGQPDAAITQITEAVRLLEETMKITGKIPLPTSCRFLDGMEWWAEPDWSNLHNDPDAAPERIIFISSTTGGVTSCYCVYPSACLKALRGKEFEPLFHTPAFEALCERVRALIVTKPKTVKG